MKFLSSVCLKVLDWRGFHQTTLPWSPDQWRPADVLPEQSPISIQDLWAVGPQSPLAKFFLSSMLGVGRWPEESRTSGATSILEPQRPLSSSLFSAADCFCTSPASELCRQFVWFFSFHGLVLLPSKKKKVVFQNHVHFLCATGGFKSRNRKFSASFCCCKGSEYFHFLCTEHGMKRTNFTIKLK